MRLAQLVRLVRLQSQRRVKYIFSIDSEERDMRGHLRQPSRLEILMRRTIIRGFCSKSKQETSSRDARTLETDCDDDQSGICDEKKMSGSEI